MMTRLQYLLTKLAEEASEISQISLKSQAFGLDEKKDGQGLSNKERIHLELNDLNAIVHMLNCEYDFNYHTTDGKHQLAMSGKIERVEHWYKYSNSLGNVE